MPSRPSPIMIPSVEQDFEPSDSSPSSASPTPSPVDAALLQKAVQEVEQYWSDEKRKERAVAQLPSGKEKEKEEEKKAEKKVEIKPSLDSVEKLNS